MASDHKYEDCTMMVFFKSKAEVDELYTQSVDFEQLEIEYQI